MNILLTGASGFIGSHLLHALTAQGHQVTACVRDTTAAQRRFSKPRYIACDFTRDLTEEAWLPRLAGIDVVINAVGIIRERDHQTFAALHRDAPIALFHAAARCEVRRVIQISALGADKNASSRYHLSKRAADDVLSTLDLPWIILRPSIVYGAGARSTELFQALAAQPVTFLPDDGGQLLQPIHIDDLVRVVLRCLEPDAPSRMHLDLVGPQPLTYAEWLAQWRRWLGMKSARSLHIPYALLQPLARIWGRLSDVPLDGETLAMLRRGNTAPVQPLQRFAGFMPHALNEVLAQTPSTEVERRHARLYFLSLPLRLSIALVWVTSGMVSAFFYPAADSYALLAQIGITGWAAPVALYGAATLDVALGAATLLRRHVRIAAQIQIVLIIGYSIILTMALPEYWLHPFGPVTKNLPLLAATAVMLAWGER